MLAINRDQELIFKIKKSQIEELKQFLHSMDLRNENSDVLDELDNDRWHPDTFWDATSEDGEHFYIMLGQDHAHVFLKKNDKFEQLREKFLKFFDWKS